MRHVVRGRLNKQIAADLLIAEQTVKQHRGRVMEKMGVHSVADLVRACEAGDLAADPPLQQCPVVCDMRPALKADELAPRRAVEEIRPK
jgi:hypothetical protein